MKTQQKKILAVASGGGHWVELLRLRPAFEGCRVVYVTTQKNDISAHRVIDGNQWSLHRVVIMFVQISAIILREKPDVIISTGAAPGLLSCIIGKLYGARTLWLESLANAETPSLSTKLVRRFADARLTQWPHMEAHGLIYKGSVL